MNVRDNISSQNFLEYIAQNGKVILGSDDGISIRIIFNNLNGRNFGSKEYKAYLKYVAYEDMGFIPGEIQLYRHNVIVTTAMLPTV